MPPPSSDRSQAVVICTCNRPADLQRTLQSLASSARCDERQLLVVDASDDEARAQNRRTLQTFDTVPWTHHAYLEAPSLARQRNYALDSLSPAVEIVHFIDDDVTVQPGYFEALARALRTHPHLGGVGGLIDEPNTEESRSAPERLGATRLKRLFLLDHTTPGRVLPSGCTTSAQHPPALDSASPDALIPTEWLAGASCSFRRAHLDRHRFDPALEGYAMLEDLDLSYRIGRSAPLAVVPQARLLHHRSPANRYAAKHMARARMIHRRWFVEKNLTHPLRHAAFWWSVIGVLLAILSSDEPTAPAALRGTLRGIGDILRRNDPLLT